MIHRRWAGVAALLVAGLWGAAPAGPAQGAVPGAAGDHYTTVELIQRTVQGLPQCLHYCLLGFDIRIRYLGYAVKVYIVPRVEHHLAALQVMTSDRFPKEAYTEWAALVGEIQKRLLDALARTAPPRLGGQPLVESSGGETRAGDDGSQPAVSFKEAEIMGHPVAYLAVLLDSHGALRANAAPGGATGGADGIGGVDGVDGVDGAAAAGFLQRWSAWSAGCFSDPNACPPAPDFPVSLLSAAFQIQAYGAALLTAVQDSRVDFSAIACSTSITF